jgi:hypothetical protein
MKPKTSIPECEVGHARLDRRADAIFDFVVSLADGGDDKAAAFLNKLLGGGFDGHRTSWQNFARKTALNRGREADRGC